MDVPWKWLNFFLEDDAKLEQVCTPQPCWVAKREKHLSLLATRFNNSTSAPPHPTQIGREYASGRMLTGEIKGELIAVLVEMVERHKAARELVTDDVVDAFMAVRPMDDLWG